MKRQHISRPAVQPRKRPNSAHNKPFAKKRTLTANSSRRNSSPPPPPSRPSSDEVSSDENEQEQQDLTPQEEEDQHETAAEKRLRLAKLYLDEMQMDAESDDDEDDMHSKLRDKANEARLWKCIPATYFQNEKELVKFPRGHQLSITCIAVSPDLKYIYSGSKDGSVIQWNAETRTKQRTILGLTKTAMGAGHTSQVQCMTTTAEYLITGSGKRVNVWTLDTLDHVKQFESHRDLLLGCSSVGTELYTCSSDRTVKAYDLGELTYVETLFGHQDSVTCMDVVQPSKLVTCGGRDGTVRVWKVIDESQLVYRHSRGCVDHVVSLATDVFVTGDESGSLYLWHNAKKKHVFKVPAHAHWITALAKADDVVVSGSWDGLVKCWRVDRKAMVLTLVHSVAVPPGVVNALVLRSTGDGVVLYIGMGQEHKLGRWWQDKKARNVIYQVTY